VPTLMHSLHLYLGNRYIVDHNQYLINLEIYNRLCLVITFRSSAAFFRLSLYPTKNRACLAYRVQQWCDVNVCRSSCEVSLVFVHL
jgi:hypothetical protein